MTEHTSQQEPPKHIAVIMDGNGRWAKRRGLPRTMGHKKGAESAKAIVENAANAGIKYITLFGFSSENWNRPEDEIQELMKILRQYLRSQTADFHKKNARLSVIGDRSAFDQDIVELIESAEQLTKNNDSIHVIIALNYGGRADIANAAHQIINKSIESGTTPDIQDMESLMNAHLHTKDIPEPDLLIRTSGEQRISNFLLWQCAYAEMYFTETHWPDFDKKELQKALDSYASRERRFGGLKKSEV